MRQQSEVYVVSRMQTWCNSLPRVSTTYCFFVFETILRGQPPRWGHTAETKDSREPMFSKCSADAQRVSNHGPAKPPPMPPPPELMVRPLLVPTLRPPKMLTIRPPRVIAPPPQVIPPPPRPKTAVGYWYWPYGGPGN
jgi:hypothetical protein